MTRPLSVIIFAGFLLTACQTPAPEQKFPDLTYVHLGALNLNVAALDVVSDYRAPLKKPNVEHLFPTPPEKALERWARDRLKAGGNRGSARFIITQAAVTETSLKLKTGLTGAFTTDQAERYDAVIEATLEIYGPDGIRKAFASARVIRSRTVPEGISLNDREKMWFSLTEALMRNFNTEMENNIRSNLGGHLL
jgi:hypothetical protein